MCYLLVLILVLMEYGLGDGDNGEYHRVALVLILVLMEYGLGAIDGFVAKIDEDGS